MKNRMKENKKMGKRILIGLIAAALLVSSPAVYFADNDETTVETQAPEKETEKEKETKAPETEAPEPETEAPETEAPKVEETQAPETEAPKVEETKAPETEAPKVQETQAPETKAPETKETAASDDKKDEEKKDAKDKKDDKDKKDPETKDTEAADVEEPEEEEEEEVETQAIADGTEPDTNADVEDEKDWKASLPKKLNNDTKKDLKEADYREDIVAIAKSQVGYKESKKNFKINDNETISPYSRYGAWYQDPYAAPWDAEFVCFVLYYAAVPNVPYSGDTVKWTDKLNKKNVYFIPDDQIQPGDIIFLNDKEFHVGIITAVNDNDYEIVGEKNGEVKKFTVKKNSKKLFAYAAVVPKDKAAAEAEAIESLPAEPMTEETTAAAETEAVNEETPEAPPVLTQQNTAAVMYTDASENTALSDISIEVEGNLPENGVVRAFPVEAEIAGEKTFAAYQIIITDEEGREYHSEAGDGESITIIIRDQQLTEMLQNSEHARGWHKDDNSQEYLDYEILEDGGVRIQSDVF